MTTLEQIREGEAVLKAALAGVLPEGSPGFAQLAQMVIEAADRVRAPASFQCADGPALRALHRARAIGAMAMHRCSTDLTDGFCGPHDGVCRWKDYPHAHRLCTVQAEGLMQAMESRGMSAVWDYDPTLIVTMEKKP